MTKTLPQLSLNVTGKSDSYSIDFSIDSIGFGIHQAWIYATMFGSIATFDRGSSIAGVLGVRFTIPFLISLIVFSLCLILIGIFDQAFRRRLARKPTIVAGALLAAVGTAILLLPSLGTSVDLALEVVSGLMTGIGSSALMIAWGVRFARCNLYSIVYNAIIAIALAYLIYAIAFAQIPLPASGIVAALFPLIEIPILLREPYYRGIDSKSDKIHFSPIPVKRHRFLLAFGLPVFIFGFAIGTLRQHTVLSISELPPSMIFVVVILAAILLAVFALLSPNASQGGWKMQFRILILIVAIAIIFIPASSIESDLDFSESILLFAYICFETMIWTYFGEICQAFRVSPIMVFGIGRGLTALGSAIGLGVHYLVQAFQDVIPYGENGFTLFLMLTLVIAYAVLPDEGTMTRLTAYKEKNEQKHKFEQAQDDIDSLFDEADGDTSENPALPDPDVKDRAVETSAKPCAPESPERAKDASDPATAAGLPAAKNAPSLAKTPILTVKGASSPLPEPAASITIGSDFHNNKSSLKAKCEMVASTYLLSAREEEVMYYLAKGYNAAHIQEKLYISEGTAKTHMRHIYRKLSIHSQQELIRLVEDTVPDIRSMLA